MPSKDVFNYTVYSDGRIYSHNKDKFMNPYPDKDGYLIVDLRENGKRHTKKVHRLVAELFIDNPRGLPQVNHMDKDVTNNAVDNLEWCTNLQNSHHARGKDHALVCPNGTVYRFKIIRAFALEHQLDYSGLAKLLRGATQQYRGWVRHKEVHDG